MKYLFIIIFSLLMFEPALSAKSVQGTVPDLPPLQPAPSGVYLDYQNSLNTPPTDEPKEEAEKSEGNLSPSASSELGKSTSGVQPAALSGGLGGWKHLVFFSFVIL